MEYNIKITHNAPTFEQFKVWGVKEAYPTFYINIIFYNKQDNSEELTLNVKIDGHYYCCGSINFEDINFSLNSYKINNNMTKKQVGDLLQDQKIINIYEKILTESIAGSMIPNDPVGILEQLWDEF